MLSVDAIDMSGKHEVDLDTNIWKVGRFGYFINLLTSYGAMLCYYVSKEDVVKVGTLIHQFADMNVYCSFA